MIPIIPPHAPTFIDGMPAENYHATIALSRSGIGTLIDECPMKFWWNSPLNPDQEKKNSKDFDIGTAAHLLFLEPDLFQSKVAIVEGYTKDGKPSPGYASQDAKDQRDAAYAAGLTPLLKGELAEVLNMRTVLMAHPLAKDAFSDGVAERTHLWIDPTFGVACKARPDFECLSKGYIIDYKTAGSANPREFQKSVWEHDYFIQDPWYREGVHATTGERPRFIFVVQEKKAPYLVSLFELDSNTVEWGRKYAEKAKSIYAKCLEKNDWPGYRDPQYPDQDRLQFLELPGWAQHQLEERDERDEFFTGTKDRRFATKTARIQHQASGIYSKNEKIES